LQTALADDLTRLAAGEKPVRLSHGRSRMRSAQCPL